MKYRCMKCDQRFSTVGQFDAHRGRKGCILPEAKDK